MRYWVLLSFGVAFVSGMAVSADNIMTLKDTVKAQEQKIEALSDLKSNQSAIDTRTQLMYQEQQVLRDEQRETNRLIQQLILKIP